VLDGGANVGLDSLRSRLRDVLSVLEVVIPFCSAGRAAEVVDRDGVVPALGEALAPRKTDRARGRREDDDPDALRSSGVASKAANRLPSVASSSISSCETAAPAIRMTGGRESGPKHIS
jgi:hypothetical protein